MYQNAQAEVRKASENWVLAFNRGDVERCLAGYTEDAVMEVSPVGRFEGREAIAGFWRDFAGRKPAQLIYRDVQVLMLDQDRAVLSASWRMNIASGFISKELWVKQPSGEWLLEYDDFSVLQLLPQPLADDKRTALLVVDMQNDYFEGGLFPLNGIAEAADNAAQLIANHRQRGMPVIHIQHIARADTIPFFQAGSDGAEIHPSVAPQQGEPLIVKHYVNSFRETELQQVLIEQGIDQLVIVGAMSQMCVDAATRAAADIGYQCTVVSDACAAPDLPLEPAVSGSDINAVMMNALGFAYAEVVTTSDYLKQAA